MEPRISFGAKLLVSVLGARRRKPRGAGGTQGEAGQAARAKGGRGNPTGDDREPIDERGSEEEEEKGDAEASP